MTLADELAAIEERRRDGLISDEDAVRAKDALLAARAPRSEDRTDGPRGLTGLLIAGLFSNVLMTLAVLALVGFGIFMLVPMVYAVPILICMVFILPVLKLIEWFGDIF